MKDTYYELKPNAKKWLQAVLDSTHRTIWLDEGETTCVRKVIKRGGYYSDERKILNEITDYYNMRIKDPSWREHRIIIPKVKTNIY